MPRALTLQDVLRGMQRQLTGLANPTSTQPVVIDQLVAADESFNWGAVSAQTIAPLLPALYWRLNDASGTTAADSSGNNQTGTRGAGVTFGQPGGLAGDPSTSALFNNTSTALVTSTYSPFVVGSQRTFMGWANRTATTDFDTLVQGSPVGGTVLSVASGGGTVSFRTNTDTQGWASVWPGTGLWVHWALTYDDAAKGSELFINGVSEGVRTHASGWVAGDSFTAGGIGNNWNGYMQDVAVFEYILTAAEIALVASVGSTGDVYPVVTVDSSPTTLWQPGGHGNWNETTWN